MNNSKYIDKLYKKFYLNQTKLLINYRIKTNKILICMSMKINQAKLKKFDLISFSLYNYYYK